MLWLSDCSHIFEMTVTYVFRLKLRRSGSIEVEGVSAMFESEPVVNGGTGAMNPWVRKCLKEYITNITTRLEGQEEPLSILKQVQYGH